MEEKLNRPEARALDDNPCIELTGSDDKDGGMAQSNSVFTLSPSCLDHTADDTFVDNLFTSSIRGNFGTQNGRIGVSPPKSDVENGLSNSSQNSMSSNTLLRSKSKKDVQVAVTTMSSKSPHELLSGNSSATLRHPPHKGVSSSDQTHRQPFNSQGVSSWLQASRLSSPNHVAGRTVSSLLDGQTNSSGLVEVYTNRCRFIDLSTSKGRRRQASVVLLVSLIPIVALLVQDSVDAHAFNSELRKGMEVKGHILFCVQLSKVLHRTQQERGVLSLYLSTQGVGTTYRDVLQVFNKTNQVVHDTNEWPKAPDLPQFKSEDALIDYLQTFRVQIQADAGKMNGSTADDVINFYSDTNDIIKKWIARLIQSFKSGKLWKTLMSFYMFILSKEVARLEKALGWIYFANGGLDNRQMLQFQSNLILSQTYLARSQDYVAKVKTALDQHYKSTHVFSDLEHMRRDIIDDALPTGDSSMAQFWFSNMTVYIDILEEIQDTLVMDVVHGVDNDLDQLTNDIIEAVSICAVAVVLLPVVVIAIYRLTKKIQAFADLLEHKSDRLHIERKRSETLLFELLPSSVAQSLLNHKAVHPIIYKAVTVFYSDIVGFTSISSRSTPLQVIHMLNGLYLVFDDIVQRYKVYKVETVGDAYVVASGLPILNLDGHAEDMANVALDVRDSLSQLSVAHLPDQTLEMRIGLSSGPVVAGVVGQKMPRYCLFGETVYLASKMEQAGLPSKIHISQSTERELAFKRGFETEPRGEIHITGKGNISTYWLLRRATQANSISGEFW